MKEAKETKEINRNPEPALKEIFTINQTLEDRGKRYGPFREHAFITYSLKNVMQATNSWPDIPPYMKEALDMIAHKIGRILNGDPYYIDSWHDIIGYARLVEQILEKANTPVPISKPMPMQDPYEETDALEPAQEGPIY